MVQSNTTDVGNQTLSREADNQQTAALETTPMLELDDKDFKVNIR
jgi:hypothetical protein